MEKLKWIRKNLITVIFLVFVFWMFADYCISIANDLTNNETVVEKNEYREEFYELKESLTEKNNDEAVSNIETSAGSKVLGLYRYYTSYLTDYNDLAFKDFLLNLNAGLCRGTGMSYIPGTTFLKNDDGTLITLAEEGDFDRGNYKLHVGLLKNFMQLLDDKGVSYAYIYCPNKELCIDQHLPLGFRNEKNHNKYEFVNELFRENNISIFDLSETMIENESDAFEIFYKTDHHWKTEYGIQAAKAISEYLNLEFNYNIDTQIFDMSNYNVEKYEKCLLGSTGINSTGTFVDAEDFDIYIPKRADEYSFEVPSKNVDRDGDFKVFINEENIQNKKKWPVNAYSAYIYGNSAYVKAENKTIEDSHKILIIKDSFANVIVPYLSQVIKRIDVVDFRSGQTDHYSGDILELIEENQYDLVLFINNNFTCEFDRLYLK